MRMSRKGKFCFLCEGRMVGVIRGQGRVREGCVRE